MQHFGSSSDQVSSREAQEILKAWADRRAADGVDPNVDSVPALAQALGVSEAEVRRMLEDIRVHRRSHEIAEGILQQESQRRKKLDVTAAIGAAVAALVVTIVVAGFLFWRASATPTPAPEAVLTPFEGVAPVIAITPDPPTEYPDLPPIPAPNVSGHAIEEALAKMEAAREKFAKKVTDLETAKARREEINALKDTVRELNRRIDELERRSATAR